MAAGGDIGRWRRNRLLWAVVAGETSASGIFG